MPDQIFLAETARGFLNRLSLGPQTITPPIADSRDDQMLRRFVNAGWAVRAGDVYTIEGLGREVLRTATIVADDDPEAVGLT